MAVKGKPQDGRTGKFDPNETVSVTVRFRPGDPDRRGFEDLVTEMGVSAAEVVRRGIQALKDQQRSHPVGWAPAQEEARIAS